MDCKGVIEGKRKPAGRKRRLAMAQEVAPKAENIAATGAKNEDDAAIKARKRMFAPGKTPRSNGSR
jgi:hypothetical protein